MKRTGIFIIALVIGITQSSFASVATTDPITWKDYKVSKTTLANTNPFCLAIAEGDFELVKKLIVLGVDVNKISNEKTPLMYASRYNHAEIVKLLLANGANLSVKDKFGNDAAAYAKNARAVAVQEVLAFYNNHQIKFLN